MIDDLENLLPIFLEESRENIEKCHEAFSQILQSPNRKTHLDNVARYIHTIKGSCGTFNLTEVRDQAHSMENLLHQYKDDVTQLNEEKINELRKELDKIDDMLFPETEVPENSQPLSTQVKATESNEFLRVPIDMVNKAINNVWEIFLLRNQLAYIFDLAKKEQISLKDLLMEWELLDVSLSRNISDIESEIMAMRMTSLKGLFSRLEKVVRSYLKDNDEKDIIISFRGEDVEVDKKVSDMLIEPLIHLLRNAIDHGIENKDERLKSGKSQKGKVEIVAESHADSILIKVIDDGRGIYAKKIIKKALEKGLIKDGNISSQEAIQLIFAPGFSTAEKVSDISGRGVGMDSVNTSVNQLSGKVKVDTTEGKGSIFSITLPLSVSVIYATVMEAGNRKFGVNINDIVEIIYSNCDEIKSNNGKKFLNFRGKFIDLIDLDYIFSLDTQNDSPSSEAYENCPIIVASCDDQQYALKVGKVGKNREIIVKPVPDLVPKWDYVEGMTILPTGEPVFIISLSKVIQAEKSKKFCKLGTQHAA